MGTFNKNNMKKCKDPMTGCDLDCINCEVPTYEPEDCEDCATLAEENGFEYEANFSYVDDHWICCNCRRGV